MYILLCVKRKRSIYNFMCTQWITNSYYKTISTCMWGYSLHSRRYQHCIHHFLFFTLLVWAVLKRLSTMHGWLRAVRPPSLGVSRVSFACAVLAGGARGASPVDRLMAWRLSPFAHMLFDARCPYHFLFFLFCVRPAHLIPACRSTPCLRTNPYSHAVRPDTKNDTEAPVSSFCRGLRARRSSINGRTGDRAGTLESAGDLL